MVADLTIERLRAAHVVARSPKLIGKNSRRDDHGDTYREWIVRVETAGGLEGIARVRGGLEQLTEEAPKVLGRDAREFFDYSQGVSLTALEFGVWDLVGKAQTKPVHDLLQFHSKELAEFYDRVVANYYAKVNNICLRFMVDPEEAERITRETFMRARQSLSSIRGDSGAFTRLYRIAINLCHHRTKQLKQERRRNVPRPSSLRTSPSSIPCASAYDGSLYFADLLYPERGVLRVREEAAESVARGFRALKMKIGRGHQWMAPAEGFRRDVECIRAVRATIGDEVLIMVDGNNGFDCDGAIRMFEAIGDYNIFWAEEMFPETVEDYSRFKSFLRERGWNTLIADGETQESIEPMRACHEAGLIDVNQLDINRVGLTEWIRLCRDVLPGFPVVLPPARAPFRCVLASPHTWGSPFGLWVSLNLAVFPNFLIAEVPAYEHDALVPVGFEWRHGSYRFTGAPGLGIVVNERVWNEQYRSTERVFE